MHFDPTSVEPQIANLGIKLGEAALRNTVGAVSDKVKLVKARKNDKEIINELEEIINSLIADKNELVRIGEAYGQELVAQQISQDNIEYITESFIPRLKELVDLTTSDNTAANIEKFVDALKPLLSVEMLTVLQLVGFNFKRAIGEPLTLLLQKTITSKVPADPQSEFEYKKLVVAFNIEVAKIAQDQDASDRWEQLKG
jgi:hypothetical protein